MIAHLKGKVIKKTDKGIILDTNDIGYFIHLAKNLLADIDEDQIAELFIHSHIKEDAFDLYGFPTYEELDFFTKAINVSGVGPKVALEMLNISQNKLLAAIANEDEAFICRIPGIGKKTAKRIILDLKDKIESIEDREYKSITTQAHTEALDALIKLGYQRREVIKIIRDLPDTIAETEAIITYFLKNS